jgi:hypothetical protein
MKLRLHFFILFLCFASISEARVFNINKETFAAYFGFTGGPSFVGKSGFENEAAANVTYSSDVKYNYTGEFGCLVSNPYVSARFGLEILKPVILENLVAKNGAADLYSQTSEILGYLPKLSLEFNLRRDHVSRSFLTATSGYGYLTLKNIYTLAAAGTTAYPGMDTTMEAKGSAVMWGAGIGQEFLLSDTTTFLFEIGYRVFKVENMKYTRDGNYFGTAHASGADLQNNGSSRIIDLSGSFVGISFRFFM